MGFFIFLESTSGRRFADCTWAAEFYSTIRYDIELAAKHDARTRSVQTNIRAALALPSRDRAVIYVSLCGN